MNEEPDPEKMPPTLEDFPYEVQVAVTVYPKLGDRIQGDVGYLGKDFTTLPLHIKINRIDNEDIFLETLLRLDEKTIKTSAEALRREREKLKKH